MAFATLSLSVRHGALLSSSLRVGRSNARLFSSVLQNSTSRVAVRPFAPRFISTSNTPSTPVDASAAIPEPVLSDVAPEATSMVANGMDTASTIVSQIPPLQYGDLAAMGLAGWSPAGLVRWSLEIINVSMDMPWFWTIIAGTVFWRVVCLPFTIAGMRETAKMQPHNEQFTKLREAVVKSAGDTMATMKAQAAMKAYVQKHGLKPLKGMIGLVQLPVTLGMFLGVQKLVNLPLEQMKESGVSFIPDLTVADPTYILPAAMFALVNVQISAGAKDMNMKVNPAMPHMLNLFRVFSLVGFGFMSYFPSGLMVSLLTTSAFTLAQTIILQRPIVRAMLDIPIIPKVHQGKMPGWKESIRYFGEKIRGY